MTALNCVRKPFISELSTTGGNCVMLESNSVAEKLTKVQSNVDLAYENPIR